MTEVGRIRAVIRRAVHVLNTPFGYKQHDYVQFIVSREGPNGKWSVSARAWTRTSSSEPRDKSPWITSATCSTELSAYRSLMRVCRTELARRKDKIDGVLSLLKVCDG